MYFPVSLCRLHPRVFDNVIARQILDSFSDQRPREKLRPTTTVLLILVRRFRLQVGYGLILYIVPARAFRSHRSRPLKTRPYSWENVKPFLWPDVIQRVGSGILHASGADASGVQRSSPHYIRV